MSITGCDLISLASVARHFPNQEQERMPRWLFTKSEESAKDASANYWEDRSKQSGSPQGLSPILYPRKTSSAAGNHCHFIIAQVTHGTMSLWFILVLLLLSSLESPQTALFRTGTYVSFFWLYNLTGVLKEKSSRSQFQETTSASLRSDNRCD